MGKHGRRSPVEAGTMKLRVMPGGVGLYPRPGETPEQTAEWLDRSWSAFRVVCADRRLFGLIPYDGERYDRAMSRTPALDPRTGQRRAPKVRRHRS